MESDNKPDIGFYKITEESWLGRRTAYLYTSSRFVGKQTKALAFVHYTLKERPAIDYYRLQQVNSFAELNAFWEEVKIDSRPKITEKRQR